MEYKPGFFKMRNGQKAEVLAVRGDYLYGLNASNNYGARWLLTGEVQDSPNDPYTLIEPWREPVEVDLGWINIYKNGAGGTFYSDKGAADRVASQVRIDCRHLKYVEGKGVIDITDKEE